MEYVYLTLGMLEVLAYLVNILMYTSGRNIYIYLIAEKYMIPHWLVLQDSWGINL